MSINTNHTTDQFTFVGGAGGAGSAGVVIVVEW